MSKWLIAQLRKLKDSIEFAECSNEDCNKGGVCDICVAYRVLEDLLEVLEKREEE